MPNPQVRGPPLMASPTAYSINSQLPFASGDHFLHLQPEDVLCHAVVTRDSFNII